MEDHVNSNGKRLTLDCQHVKRDFGFSVMPQMEGNTSNKFCQRSQIVDLMSWTNVNGMSGNRASFFRYPDHLCNVLYPTLIAAAATNYILFEPIKCLSLNWHAYFINNTRNNKRKSIKSVYLSSWHISFFNLFDAQLHARSSARRLLSISCFIWVFFCFVLLNSICCVFSNRSYKFKFYNFCRKMCVIAPHSNQNLPSIYV